MSFTLVVRGLQSALFVTVGDNVHLENQAAGGGRAISYETPGSPPFGIPGGKTRVGTFLPVATADFGGFVTMLKALGVPVPDLDSEGTREIAAIMERINAGTGSDTNKLISALQRLVDQWSPPD